MFSIYLYEEEDELSVEIDGFLSLYPEPAILHSCTLCIERERERETV